VISVDSRATTGTFDRRAAATSVERVISGAMPLLYFAVPC
jgi:hypothetical protein